jgi:hypothetical protein
VASLAALVIWLGFNAGAEPVMGLRMHPLFTVTLAFGLLALLPLLRPARGWGWPFAVSLLAALGLAVVAGFQPAFSETAPERLNLRYIELDGKAWWQADPVPRLPEALRAAAHFSPTPQWLLQRGYLAPGARAQFPAPSAMARRDGDEVTLNLNAAGDGMALVVPQEAGLKSITIGDMTVPADGRQLLITCATPDCGSARVILNLSSAGPVVLTLIAQRRGLPPEETGLAKARGATAVPSQVGDEILLGARVTVPGR